MQDLCHSCDLYVGYGGAGVFKPPEDKDVTWLSNHCWSCGRTKEEIIEINKKYNGFDSNEFSLEV